MFTGPQDQGQHQAPLPHVVGEYCREGGVKYSPTMKDRASVRLGGGEGWEVVRDSKQLRLL